MAKKKTAKPVERVSYRQRLDAYGSAKSLIAEIEFFLKEHNLDDASIDIGVDRGYYDEVSPYIMVEYYGPKPAGK